MNKAVLFAIALSLPIAGMAQVEEFYSDTQAAAMAKELRKEAVSLRDKVEASCGKETATAALGAMAESASDKVSAWPNDHLKYRALFPYHACRQTMANVNAQATSCAIGRYQGEAKAHDQKVWARDLAECDASIEKPDLSLKEIE